MGKLDAVLRAEITRLARKELKAVAGPLQKQIRELSRQVRGLSVRASQLERRASRTQKVQQPERSADLSAPPEEVERSRLSGGLIRKLRRKLSLTQAQLAGLIGVSPAAVQSWEQNIARPAGENRAGIVALRKLGRREVARMLEEKGVAPAARKPRTDVPRSEPPQVKPARKKAAR